MFLLFSSSGVNLYLLTSAVAQMVKNLLAMQETQVRSLDQEIPLEKDMVTHFSIFTQRTLWPQELGRLQSMGSQRVVDNWATDTFTVFQNLCFLREVRTWKLKRNQDSPLTASLHFRFREAFSKSHQGFFFALKHWLRNSSKIYGTES